MIPGMHGRWNGRSLLRRPPTILLPFQPSRAAGRFGILSTQAIPIGSTREHDERDFDDVATTGRRAISLARTRSYVDFNWRGVRHIYDFPRSLHLLYWQESLRPHSARRFESTH